jgi:NifU-like protein involved in Fe-S cluster formation
LRALLIAAPGAGRLDGADVATGTAEHPACGDRLEIDLRVRDGKVDALAWRASACPATTAVACVAATVLPGQPLASAPSLVQARLRELGGLQAHERHAESMLLRALDAAGGHR